VVNQPFVRARGPRAPILLSFLVALALVSVAPTALASSYELRFCAPLNSWPAADRTRGGYDVEIALLLAEEFGAEASFEWIRFNEVGVRDSLHSGLCDLMVGMGEGVAGTLSSIAYLRTPYVFVSLEERDIDIASMDDPVLRDLTIGTYQFGTPTIALANRNLDDRVEFAAAVTDEGVDTHTPIIEAVLDGTVDVGIVYGPVAGARVAAGAPLRLEQVRPEIDFGESIIQLSRIWTIGVRPHDEALRDRVNAALARRWSDVQAILATYGVPTLELSRPREAAALPADVLRVGIVHPSRTPAQLPGFEVGELARLGTLLAENELGRTEALDDRVKIYEASAPTAASTLRSATGLVLLDNVDVLIGGFDEDQALGLAALAAENDVVFLNAGAEHASLRAPRCFPTTVHVAPDVDGYVRGLISSGLGRDPAPVTWFTVVEAPYADDGGLGRIEALVADGGGTHLGSAVVETGQFLYLDAIDAIDVASPDAVLLIMNEDQQELFLSQADGIDPAWSVTGLPTLRSQSRAFLQRFLQVSPDLLRTPRIAAWDPSLENDVNDRFASRTASVMGGTAWTTYAAFLLAFDAADAQVGRDATTVIEHWRSRDGLDVGKAEPASLRSADHQLASTLYLVEPVRGTAWGRSPAEKTATARVVTDVPASDAWPPLKGEVPTGEPAACPAP